MKAYIFWIYLCIQLNLIFGDDVKTKIAIIGAGIGGTSCALYLRDMLKNTVEISIYEKNKIGGRLALIFHNNVNYEPVEFTVLNSDKHTMKLIKKFSLKTEDPKVYTPYKNGKPISVTTGLKKIPSYVKMDAQIAKLNIDFNKKVYENQKIGKTFITVREVLGESFMKKFDGYNAQNYFFKPSKLSSANEDLYKSYLEVVYGYKSDCPAFAGYRVFRKFSEKTQKIIGGNHQLAVCCYRDSTAILIHQEVIKIRRIPGGEKSEIISIDKNNIEKNLVYDYVVMAAPLAENLPKIEFLDYENPINIKGLYKKKVFTLLVGKLKSEFSKLTNIAFVEDENIDYMSEHVNPSNSNLHYWKILSEQELTESEFDRLFEVYGRSIIKVSDLFVYPDYKSRNLGNDSFKLAENLFYINSIEWAASAIEMILIGSKNVSKMIHYSTILKSKSDRQITHHPPSNATFTNDTKGKGKEKSKGKLFWKKQKKVLESESADK